MADTLKELFEHELRDVYDAESRMVRSLEQMAKKVSNQELQTSFLEHKEMTQQQLQRLEQVFELVGRKPRRESCKGMIGLIEEWSTFLREEKAAPEILDAVALASAVKVEHYEMAAYRALISIAQTLGLQEAVGLLEETLAEEEQTAQLLESKAQDLLAEADPGEITLPQEQGAR